MKKHLLITSFTITSIIGIAQTANDSVIFDISTSGKVISVDSLKSIYEREIIALGIDGEYIKNGKKYKTGFLFRKLQKELKRSKEAQSEMKIYRQMISRGLIVYSVGFVGGLSLSIITASPIPFLLFIPGTIGLIEATNAIEHLNKAINLYNRDALINSANNISK